MIHSIWTRRALRWIATMPLALSVGSFAWVMARLLAAQQRDLLDSVNVDLGGEG